MIVQLVQAAWRSRGFIAGSVLREFSVRYRSSLLGTGWALVNPLAMVLVYLVVFSQIMPARLPGSGGAMDYAIYLCAGVLAWGFFAEILQRSISMFLDHAGLMKKLHFPRVCLPLIVIANATMNFTMVFGVFLLLLALAGEFPGPGILAVPLVMLVLGAFACGLGTAAGMLNVFFRDVGQALGIVLQVWFWLTPIVYPPGILPAWIAGIVAMNPLTPLIGVLQHLVLGEGWPQWQLLWMPSIVALIACVFSGFLFRRHAAEIVDEL